MVYFMGAHEHKKKDGSSYYTAVVLGMNKFNEWETTKFFVSYETYAKLSSNISVGRAMIPEYAITNTGNGVTASLVDGSQVADVPALDLIGFNIQI